jgi:hypothetical protein
MNKTMRWLSLSLVVAAVTVHFTNCSAYAPQPVNFVSQASVNCTDDDCITPSIDNLSLRVNYGGGSEFSVTPDLAEFNLGGDCNEGGFPYNTVRWELYLNNQMVRHSGMIPADSRCINGRFLIYVYLGANAGGDPVNRTGLMTQAGTRSPYDLWIEVYGQNTPNGTPQRNTLKGRMRMSLLAP